MPTSQMSSSIKCYAIDNNHKASQCSTISDTDCYLYLYIEKLKLQYISMGLTYIPNKHSSSQIHLSKTMGNQTTRKTNSLKCTVDNIASKPSTTQAVSLRKQAITMPRSWNAVLLFIVIKNNNKTNARNDDHAHQRISNDNNQMTTIGENILCSMQQEALNPNNDDTKREYHTWH